MTTSILSKSIEIRIVHRSGYYFYNRIENGLEVVQCLSIGRERAQEIFDANQETERQIVEGEPFNEGGQTWAWSAWVRVEEAANGSQ